MGIDIYPINKPIRYKRKNDFTDIWVVKQDINLDDIKMQKEEVSDVKWVTIEELRAMICRGEFYRYSDEYFGLLLEYIKDNNKTFGYLETSSESSMDFWNSDMDDEVWNNV